MSVLDFVSSWSKVDNFSVEPKTNGWLVEIYGQKLIEDDDFDYDEVYFDDVYVELFCQDPNDVKKLMDFYLDTENEKIKL